MHAFGGGGEMSRQDASRLLSACLAHDIREIDIMGGEPLLLGWMPDFIREAVGKGVRINLSTNGSCTDAVGELRGTDSGLFTAGVSLEGGSMESHRKLTRSDHFDRAVASLRLLLDIGLDPLVKTVVSRETTDEVPGIIGLVRGMGVRRLYLIHMDALGGGDAASALGYVEFDSFFRRTRDDHVGIGIGKVAASCFNSSGLPAGARCAGGVLKLAIGPDGSAYPCNLFMGGSEFRLGNILTDGIEAVWNNRRLDFFRTAVENSCPRLSCPNRKSCTGGCPAHGYYHFGDLASPDIRCGSPAEAAV